MSGCLERSGRMIEQVSISENHSRTPGCLIRVPVQALNSEAPSPKTYIRVIIKHIHWIYQQDMITRITANLEKAERLLGSTTSIHTKKNE